MDKDKSLHNLPLLFEQLGLFIDGLVALQERWPASKPELDNLFMRRSQSTVDAAKETFQKIIDIMYDSTLQGCSGGSTRMGK